MNNRIILLPFFALLILFTILSLLSPIKSFADAITVTLPLETTIQTGSERTIPIAISGAQDLGALQFELAFNDDIMEIVDVARGSGIPPVLMDFNIIGPGLLRVALAGSEPIDGDAKIDLRVRGLAEGSGTIELMELKAWALSTSFELLTESTPGMVKVTTGSALPATLIIAAVLLLIVILIALIFWMRKKKTPAKPQYGTVPLQTGQRPQAPPSMKSFCQQCGQQLPMNTAFCDQCGAKV